MSDNEWADDHPSEPDPDPDSDVPAGDSHTDPAPPTAQPAQPSSSPAAPAAEAAEAVEAAPRLYYGSVDEFVREMIVPVFRRQVGERGARRWAAEWWRNTEATIRLEALWRAWEHLRLDPATGISVWLRDHADHHLAVLWDPDGPFAKSTDSCRPGEPLPYTPPPPRMFPDLREQPEAE